LGITEEILKWWFFNLRVMIAWMLRRRVALSEEEVKLAYRLTVKYHVIQTAVFGLQERRWGYAIVL
jgi:hypothetical protein